jgi:hypothetical protein
LVSRLAALAIQLRAALVTEPSNAQTDAQVYVDRVMYVICPVEVTLLLNLALLLNSQRKLDNRSPLNCQPKPITGLNSFQVEILKPYMS